jgi:predicted regulator of Ras-like GTPase activity (Roadblock/LC7/MglB family)
MYKLSRRKNLIPFLVLIVVGLLVSVFLPPMFPDSVFEIPAFALFPAEIALVMMLAVFFFENATPSELIKLSFTMLGICMFSGALCNMQSKTSQQLPDATLMLNWIQLICMNITGLIGTIALYQTKAPELSTSATRTTITTDSSTKTQELPPAEATASAHHSDQAEKLEIATGESAKEILSKLEGRFNDLETQRQASQSASNQSISLESLFADESQAAKSTNKELEPAALSGSLDDLLGGNENNSENDINEERLNRSAAAMTVNKPSIQTPMPTPPAVSTPEPPIVNAPPVVLDESSVDIGLDDLDFMSSPTEPTPPPVVATKSEESKSLFDDVSGDLDDIFSNLAPEAQDDFTPSKLAEIKSDKPETPQPVTPPGPADSFQKVEGKLFDDVSGDLDDIFANLAPEEAQKKVGDMLDLVDRGSSPSPGGNGSGSAPTPTQPAPVDAKPREVKEFGRLSGAATAKTELAAPGTLKTIGQMLLDTHAIENIIKRSEGKDNAPSSVPSAATAKVVSVARGADIQAMFNKICAYPGVDGCLVIGKDGLLIGATDSLGMMRDVLGVLALGIHSTSNLGTKKIDMGDLRQMVMRTGQKLTVLTEIGIGVMATFSDTWNLSALDGMLDHIGRVVTDSQASGGASLPMESLSGGLLASEPTPAPPPPTPVVAPMPEPGGEAVIPITEAKGGLLSVTDDDLGGLFENVLADPAKQNDNIGGTQIADPPKPAVTAQTGSKPLLSVNDDDMSDLFDNLLDKSESAVEISMDFSPEAETAAPAPAPAEVAKAPEPAAAEVKKEGKQGQQIKEFGRLSASSASQAASADGAIKAIGRQLIDVQAVENIIKSGEKREKMGAGLTTARVISAARGEGIRALLTKIDGSAGVQGSLIVGNDGLVIASTLQGGLDKDLLGALCTAMHSHTDLAARKLQMGKLRQIIFHCDHRLTVLTAVAVGVLAVFVDTNDMNEIDTLLAAIEGTVRG